MDPALLVLSHLDSLVGIIRSAYNEYRRICHNREKCHHLIQRAEKIVIAIDNEIVKVGRPDGLEDAVKRLRRCEASIRSRSDPKTDQNDLD
jgi:hypothetical protein